MRLRLRKVNLQLSTIFLLMLVGSIGMTSSAMAMMSPSPGATSPVVTGDDSTITYTYNQPDSPHRSDVIRVYHPNFVQTVAGGFAACPLPLGTGDYWELRTTGVGAGTVGYQLDVAGAKVTVSFGNGGTPTIFAEGGAIIRIAGVNQAANADVVVEWFKINVAGAVIGGTGGSDDTTTNGTYVVLSCGGEGNALYTEDYAVPSSFTVQPPVGGTVLSIDATSLILAGALSSAFWIIPVLGVGAGAAFALLRYQVNKQTN